MYKSIFFVLFVFSTTLLQSQIAVSPVIMEATVYVSGAKLSSQAKVRIPAGKSEVVFENISPNFNSNSLQVRIGGNAVLNSAVFRLKTPPPPPQNPRVGVLQDSIWLLGEDLTRNRDEKSILEKESALLETGVSRVGSTTTGQSAVLSLAELRETMAYFTQRRLEIRERQLQLANKERLLNQHLSRLNAEIQRQQPNAGKSSGEIILKIEAETAQTLDIECTYLVSSAGWSPLYDLRSAGFGKPLQLVYKANIYNRSGFDWKNVQLHLSSAQPLANNNRPILNPLYVDFRVAQVRPLQKAKQEDSNRANMAYAMTDNLKSSRLMEPEDNDGVFDAGNNGEFLTVFDLPKKQDILADGKENILTVQETDMPAEYEYHAVPKLEPAVFLLAKIADYGKYSLLPGTANIFFESTFIGQVTVNPNVASDTLLLSLGRDEQVVIKRTQPVDFTEKRRKILSNNRVKETYVFEIMVKNNKAVPVTVNILDQIPISKQKEIEVELLDAGKGKEFPNVGGLEWNVDLEPGKSKKLRFSYSVTYPSGTSPGFGN